MQEWPFCLFGETCRHRSRPGRRCNVALRSRFFLQVGTALLLLPLLSSTLRLLDRRMCRGKARDGDSEGGAAHVVQAHVVAELDAAGVAAVFAADAALEVGGRLPA